jgi:hypothetical protein
MDINSLQVFNYLNKLGITDEEFKDIEETPCDVGILGEQEKGL